MKKGELAFEGTIKEGFERRYTILNERDYEKYVDLRLQSRFEDVFGEVLEQIEDGRYKDGKEPFNNYVVINLDEPYIDKIIEIMKDNGHWG